MLNCKQTAELMTQALDRRLGFREWIGLRLHLMVCDGCSNARKHFRFIREACSDWIRRGE